MSSIYDKDWTIRGLVGVDSDIFMLPGDELRILGEGNGPYRIIVQRGDRVWEGCRDLMAYGEIEPVIGIQAPANSRNLSDGGAYNAAIRTFIDNTQMGWKRLEGTLPTVNSAGEPEVANVSIWAPKIQSDRRVLVIHAEHRNGEADQNGTGHGDHR